MAAGEANKVVEAAEEELAAARCRLSKAEAAVGLYIRDLLGITSELESLRAAGR